MPRINKTAFLIILCLFIFKNSVLNAGAVPRLINYQGKLTYQNGKCAAGNYKLTFRIYDSETAGNLLWEEIHPSVSVVNGGVEIFLGSVTPLNLSFDKPYFLELVVGQDVMRPRQRIASAGYVLKAETVEETPHAQVADTIQDSSFLVPRGGIIFCKTGCPTGYKRVGELDGKFLVAGPAYYPNAGGSNTRTIGLNNMPAHMHDLAHGHGAPVAGSSGSQSAFTFNPTPLSNSDGQLIADYRGETETTGSGQPLDIRPEFSSLVMCEKE